MSNNQLCKCGKVGAISCPNDERCGTSNNQLPADVQGKINKDALLARQQRAKDLHDKYEIEGYEAGYITGATAEAESIQPVIDAAEKVAKLFAHKGDNQACAICQLANALQQWKEGKEVGNEG